MCPLSATTKKNIAVYGRRRCISGCGCSTPSKAGGRHPAIPRRFRFPPTCRTHVWPGCSLTWHTCCRSGSGQAAILDVAPLLICDDVHGFSLKMASSFRFLYLPLLNLLRSSVTGHRTQVDCPGRQLNKPHRENLVQFNLTFAKFNNLRKLNQPSVEAEG